MKPLTFEETIAGLEGALDKPAPKGSVTRIVIDSRQVEPHDLFIAIKGDRFDGHDFVGEALTRGAQAAVVSQSYEPPLATSAGALPSDATLIRVDDTVLAMGRLARYYRRRVIHGSVTVIAVTGSNGKTTTKMMIHHVLSGRWPGKASLKSFNNEIGVPLTLLSADPGERFVICEVGTNAPGEIAALAKMVEPEIAVLTGISEAHLERLGSIENICEEKLSLFKYLPTDGFAICNADHEALRARVFTGRSLPDVKMLTFGFCEQADLRLTDVRVVPGEGDGASVGLAFKVNDRFEYRLPVPGRHNAVNALAAIAVARRMGLDHDEIAERLATFSLPAMRLQVERFGDMTVINDAYNANPASLAAAVDVLVETPASGRRVLIVGEMRELGPASDELHIKAAERIAGSGVDFVVTVGPSAETMTKTIEQESGDAIASVSFETTADAKKTLASYLRADDTVLLKGSRAVGLEQLIDVLKSASSSSQPSSESSRVARQSV